MFIDSFIIIIHCCCRTIITVFINEVEIMEERQNFNIQMGKKRIITEMFETFISDSTHGNILISLFSGNQYLRNR